MFRLFNTLFKRALLLDLLRVSSRVLLRLLSRVLLLNALLTLAAPLALAQTLTVQNAWVRPTVPGQTASGAYMTLTASTPARLKSASTPAAALTELHTMRMEGDIMKMLHLADGLELPAGKPVQLQPGGYHLMLLDLQSPLKKGSTIALTLVWVDGRGVERKTVVQVGVGRIE